MMLIGIFINALQQPRYVFLLLSVDYYSLSWLFCLHELQEAWKLLLPCYTTLGNCFEKQTCTDLIFCLFELLLFTVVFCVLLLELLTVVCGAGLMRVSSRCVYTAIMQISREIPRLQTHAEHAIIGQSVRAATDAWIIKAQSNTCFYMFVFTFKQVKKNKHLSIYFVYVHFSGNHAYIVN